MTSRSNRINRISQRGRRSPVTLLVVLSVLTVGVIACSVGVVAQNGSTATNTTDLSESGPDNTTGLPIVRADDPVVPYPSNPSGVSITAYVTARLSDGGDTGRPTVDFTGGERVPTVRSISFATEPVDTVVRIADYNRLPPTIAPPNAEVVSSMEILVPPSLNETEATLTASVDRAAIPAEGGPTDLVVVRRVDGEWQPLPTTVVESTNSAVVIEAETSGFSYFAVVADDGTVAPGTIRQVVGPANGSTTDGDLPTDTESTSDDSMSDDESTTNDESTSDTGQTADESPTLGLGGVVGAVVLTSLLLARRARSNTRDT